MTNSGVLNLITEYGRRSETFVARHCSLLPPASHRVVPLAPTAATAPVWDDVGRPTAPVFALPAPARLYQAAARRGLVPTALGPPLARRALAAARQLDRPVALVEYGDVWAPALRHLRAAGIRSWVHLHGYDVDVLRAGGRPATSIVGGLRSADGVFVVSNEARALVEREIETPVVVKPCGYDERLFRFRERRPATSGPVRVVSVGRLVDKKSPLELMGLLDELHSAGADLDYRWIGDGPLGVACRERFGSRPWLTWIGPLSPTEVADELAAADIVVHGGRSTGRDREGLPVAVLEAMATGAALVAFDHAGIGDVAVDDVSALLVPEGDFRAMGNAVGVLIGSDPLRRRLGREAALAAAPLSSEAERRTILEHLDVAGD